MKLAKLAAISLLLIPSVVFGAPPEGKATSDVNVVNQPTVNVGNSSSNPVPISGTVTLGANVPFAIGGFLDRPAANARSASFMVPQGAMLVIELITAHLATDVEPLLRFSQFVVFTNGNRVVHELIPKLTLNEQPTFDTWHYTVNQPLKLYADGGSQVTIHFGSARPLGNWSNQSYSVSGYLMNTP